MDAKDILNLQEAYLEMYSPEKLDEAEKWIQKAIKKPGSLHKQLGVPAGEKIPAKELAAASKKGGKLGKRARLAQTLKSLNKEDFKVILHHLIDEEYTNTLEGARVIVMNMSEEWMESILEATAMAKRGLDEPAIRQRIAASTGGGAAADRATALEKRPTYGDTNKQKQRERLARAQRGDFRKTTSSSPGLHGYAHKSNDPEVKAKQAARGAQRGVLTPVEKKQFGR